MKSIKNKVLLAVGVVVMLVMVSLAGCSATGVGADTTPPISVNVGNQQTGIWVNGEGKVTVTPDLAVVTLGVSSQMVTIAEAQVKAAEAMDKIMKALADNGVAKKDIQTRYFDVQQVSRWDDKGQIETVIGYRVSNSVVAKLREMDKVGEVIDAVVAAGGDLTRINGISFSVENPQKFHQQARELAMKDAKAKAEQIANLSGVNLGKPTFVSENTYTPVNYAQPGVFKMDAAGGGAAPSTAISAGELDITLNVQVAYTIE